MHYPRAFADATILPTGDVFVNGGTAVYQGAYDDTYFGNFTPEIYKTNDDIWKKCQNQILEEIIILHHCYYLTEEYLLWRRCLNASFFIHHIFSQKIARVK